MNIKTQVADGSIIIYDGTHVIALSPEAVHSINQTIQSEEPGFMQSSMDDPWELASFCDLSDLCRDPKEIKKIEANEYLKMYPGYDDITEGWNLHVMLKNGTMDIPFDCWENISTQVAEPMLGPDVS